ncbi:MAG: STAS domain-containing protein [Mangrovicoccus sp.]
MNLSSTQTPAATVITAADSRIDASVAIQFKDKMRELTNGVSGRIVLDLSSVDFIDSSGLGSVVAALKQLDDGQSLELAALSPTVAKVFRLTRMDKVFPIHDSVEAALDTYANAS